MEYLNDKKEIKIEKNLNKLDKFILDFIRILERHTTYVIVSGYVSILLGRTRATEDIDLLIPEIIEKDFEKLWNDLYKNGFECINTSNAKEGFKLFQKHAIRFFREKPVPNIEFKKIKNELDEYSSNNKIKVCLKEGEIYISPLEMQIAYKLFLGSQKDLEDAKHLHDLFKENLNKEELDYLISKLKVNNNFKIITEEDENRFRRIE